MSGPQTPPGAGRRPYDSPLRRAQMAETRDRILDAGSALVHEFESWDWRPLTFRAVAERAGVGERTVYRHFATEQALHAAVMERLAEESGVDYEDLTIDDVSKIGAKVFAAMSTFAAPTWFDVEEGGALVQADEQRKAALLAAVEASTTGWSEEEQARAAAALDVLWTAPSYQRLVTAWKLDADDAAGVIDWMITLVVDAIRAGHAPDATAAARGIGPLDVTPQFKARCCHEAEGRRAVTTDLRDDSSVYYDPYDAAINADPYPTYRRLRDEAPIYHNERYDVWALARHADVEKALVNWETFSNSRGDILEIIQSGMELPSGVVLFEDPPLHTMHRGLMSRVFTPRRMNALESQVRAFCAACLDPLVGRERFDFVADLGAEMPMRVIGMLLGIPESAQTAVRDRSDAFLRTEAGKPMEVRQEAIANGEIYAEYIDWRAEHPSDDLMTALLNAEFDDEAGTTRRLTRDEVLTYTQVLAGAGNETTGRLIGWLGKVLGDHPDQRRQIAADPSLIPNTVEETLRFEPTGPHVARYVARDVEYYGTTVPAGSPILLLVGSANRDECRYDRPDSFDIHRDLGQHLTFGYGLHFCLGAALARLEGRVALDEVLRRFPDWEVDAENARLAPTSTVRGWDALPVVVTR